MRALARQWRLEHTYFVCIPSVFCLATHLVQHNTRESFCSYLGRLRFKLLGLILTATIAWIQVGRCGRTGRSGTAYTFLVDGDEGLAPELLALLRRGRQKVPTELVHMASAATVRAVAERAKANGEAAHLDAAGARILTEDEEERREAANANREKQLKLKVARDAKGRAQQKGRRRR